MPQETKPTDKNQGLIGDSTLEILATRYDLSAYDVVPFVSIGEDIIALNRRSNTASKAIIKERESGRKYLVKRFPWYMSERSLVDFAATYQSTVAERYDKVPDIQRNRSGEVVTPVGDDFYYVQEFVSGGQQYDKNGPNAEAICRNAGRALAELHAISDARMECSDDHRESVFDLSRGILHILETEVIDGNEHRISADEMEVATDYVEYASDRLDRLEADVGDSGHVFPVHGDYNPTNLVVEDDEVNGIVDFDNCCVGRPEHDVAEALVTFCYVNYSRNSSRFDEPDESWNASNARALLDGYTGKCDVNVQQLPAIGESIVLELFTLGLVRNELQLRTAEDLVALSQNIRDCIDDLVAVRQ